MNNNLKLRDHSRELITGPRACFLVVSLAMSPRHPCRLADIFPTLTAAFPGKKMRRQFGVSEGRPSIPFRRSCCLSPAATFAESINGARLRSFRISATTTTQHSRQCDYLPFFVTTITAADGLLRLSNEPDRRSRPPIRPRYRSSSARVFPGHPRTNFPFNSALCSMCARRGFSRPLSLSLSLSPPSLSFTSLVLDFLSGGKGGLPLNDDVGLPNDATAET